MILKFRQVGLKKFLQDGFVRGLGEKNCEKIFHLIEYSSIASIRSSGEKIKSSNLLSPSICAEFVKKIAFFNDEHLLIADLLGIGLSKKVALKAIKVYGSKSCELILKNPYILADHLWGVGFLKADALAQDLSIAPTSSFRINSAVRYFIQKSLEQGVAYVEQISFEKELLKLLGFEEAQLELVKNACSNLIFDKKIILIACQNDGKNYVALQNTVDKEQKLALTLKKFSQQAALQELDFHFDHLEREMDGYQLTFSQEQRQGIFSVFQNKLTIITGGPGTGKTTILKFLISYFKKNNSSFLLCAPTGRASKKMQEVTHSFAQTIHKLLEFDPIEKKFQRNKDNKLKADFIVIDEFSMVDMFLANLLFDAIDDKKTRVILLGDIDQLPSVGAGQVFEDLISSNIFKVVRLKRIFRQQAGSLITENAHRVNEGLFFCRNEKDFKEDFTFKKVEEAKQFCGILKSLDASFLKKHKLSLAKSIVLTPMHKGSSGSIATNAFLQDFVNYEQSSCLQTPFKKFKVGDPVIQEKNNYKKLVFNGDIGRVEKIEGEMLFVNFDSKIISYGWDELSEISLAYAISIHKSQGSEFDLVIIPIFTEHFLMLNRKMIYTAITRAKKMCVVVGQFKALAIGLKNTKALFRKTFLKRFLLG